MPVTRYLTRPEMDSLIEWVAEHGDNYDRYTRWADENHIPDEHRFTRAYLSRWIQRRRRAVQDTRQRHMLDVRAGSLLDRTGRLRKLEEDFARLELAARLLESSDPKMLVAVIEQRRKLLESIAKERGEYGVAPAAIDVSSDMNKQLQEGFARLAEKKVRDVTP